MCMRVSNLVIHIENLLCTLQLFYFHLWGVAEVRLVNGELHISGRKFDVIYSKDFNFYLPYRKKYVSVTKNNRLMMFILSQEMYSKIWGFWILTQVLHMRALKSV
jgi:hypothetical protein